MKPNRITFSNIVERTERKNSERLMAKARLANRLAKKARGTSRQTAYGIKSQALCSLVKKLSNHVTVSKDVKLTDYVVVGLKRERSGLHLPSAKLNG